MVNAPENWVVDIWVLLCYYRFSHSCRSKGVERDDGRANIVLTWADDAK
jgi:hypothetical protein